MDVSQLIQQKLNELGLDQRDLAEAVEVTESYISQLLSRKKMPPAPNRTDLYDKLERFLKLPAGKLAGLVSRSPAKTGAQEEDRESACAVVQRSSRAASRKMQPGQTTPGARHFREGTVWRT